MRSGVIEQGAAKLFQAAPARRFLGLVIQAIRSPLMPPGPGREHFTNAGNDGEEEKHGQTEEQGQAGGLHESESRDGWHCLERMIPEQFQQEGTPHQQHKEEGDLLKPQAVDVPQTVNSHAGLRRRGEPGRDQRA